VTPTLGHHRIRRQWFDAAIGTGVAALAVGELLLRPTTTAFIGLGTAAALIVRRRWPYPVFTAVIALGATRVAIDPSLHLYEVGILIAMYTVVAETRRLTGGYLAGLVVLTGCAAHAFRPDAMLPAGRIFAICFMWTVVVTVWLIALNTRHRRAAISHLARIAVNQERNRIARELHDVVAHGVAVMTAQADGATYIIDTDPQRAKQSLHTIADTGRAALADLRSTLGLLRDGPTTTQNQPARHDIEPLLAGARAAGLIVSASAPPQIPATSPGTALVVHRIIQEALTNVVKHAGAGTRVHLALSRNADVVDVKVTDDGGGVPASPATTTGHGLIGMRERIKMYGGTLTTGPLDTGGWQVHAHIPVKEN
jgi:signal transduction histidine kinase